MSTAHAMALGLLIAIGVLSVVGFIQMLLYPFNVAARVIYGAADALVYSKQMERIHRKQIEAELAGEELRSKIQAVIEKRQ